MNFAPRRLSGNAASSSRSGGLAAWTASNGRSRASRRERPQIRKSAVRYSWRYPMTLPPDGPGAYRWMAMPSISSNGSVSQPTPRGQTATTSQPLSRSDRHSRQTRMSNGTELFWTSISTLAPRRGGGSFAGRAFVLPRLGGVATVISRDRSILSLTPSSLAPTLEHYQQAYYSPGGSLSIPPTEIHRSSGATGR